MKPCSVLLTSVPGGKRQLLEHECSVLPSSFMEVERDLNSLLPPSLSLVGQALTSVWSFMESGNSQIQESGYK